MSPASVPPTNEYATLRNASELPLLLKNYDKMCVKSASYTPTDRGYSPLERPIAEYLNYGVLNLDKPNGPSSHEVVSWVKKIMELERTGHSGTLDPNVSGCLLVCLNRATRLVKSQQELGKEYVAVLKFHDPSVCRTEGFSTRLDMALRTLTCPQLQRPPAEGCAVKRVLRVREIYFNRLIEWDATTGHAVLHVSCQAGTYIRTLCVHIGLLMGAEASMAELRRVRTGTLTEKTNLVTMHDVMDAYWLYKNRGDESYLRKIVMPLERLLTGYKRVFIKDSAVGAVAYGAPLTVQGVVRYEHNIAVGDTVVICSTKGEAVAIGVAKMGALDIAGAAHGIACSLTRVIIDRDTYEKQWGKGLVSKERKELIAKGLLDPYGAITDKTPESWKQRWTGVDAYLRTAGNTCLNSTDPTATDAITAARKEVEEGDLASLPVPLPPAPKPVIVTEREKPAEPSRAAPAAQEPAAAAAPDAAAPTASPEPEHRRKHKSRSEHHRSGESDHKSRQKL